MNIIRSAQYPELSAQSAERNRHLGAQERGRGGHPGQ